MAKTLLLDTCAIIWMAEDAPITGEASRAMDTSLADDRAVLISPITAWERAMLVAKRRLASPLSPKAWFDRVLSLPGIKLAELSPDILMDASFLPQPIHNDPADRIIIATARAFDLTIVTRDRLILDYAAQGHVRALAC